MSVPLEVQVVCPVEQVDHDEGQGEGDPGVVVYVVGVFHVAAVYGPVQHLAEDSQDGVAPVPRLLRRGLQPGLAPRGAGRAQGDFHRGGVSSGGGGGGGRGGLLASLGPVGVSGDGRDDAVHLVVEVVHVVAVLRERE